MQKTVGLIAVIGFALGIALALPSSSSPAPAIRGCGQLTVPATIAGTRVCLREGRRCIPRFAAEYRRYAFVCSGGSLVVPWSVLRRRLAVPQLPPGSPCPTSSRDSRGDLHALVGWGAGVPAWGRGPGFPLLLGPNGPVQPEAELAFELPPPPGFGEWGVAKAIWFTEAGYAPGRILVRGRQLDGPNEARFEDGRPGFTDEGRLHPVPELRLTADGTGHPSTTRLRAGGCYAYQLDGRTFTRLVVFRAVVEP